MAFESVKNKLFRDCPWCKEDNFSYEGFLEDEHAYRCNGCNVVLDQWGRYHKSHVFHTPTLSCQCDDCVNSKVDQIIEEKLQ